VTPDVIVDRLDFETTNPDEACDYLKRMYGARVAVTGVDAGSIRHRRLDTGRFAFDEITTPGIQNFVAEGVERIVVTEVAAGTMKMSWAGMEECAGQDQVVCSGSAGTSHECEVRSGHLRPVSLDPALIARVLGNDAPVAVHIGSPTPGSPALAELWRRTVAYVRDVIESQELPITTLIRDSLGRTLVEALLTCFPNDGRPEPHPHDNIDTTAILLRRAVAFIETNIHRDIGTADIAYAIDVSPSAVLKMFRRHLDTTPFRHIQRVRLHCAHAELTKADPSATSVAEIASGWGFGSVHDFAALYLDTFGTSPQTTLGLESG
jgi:AraC-like DNA-binding protein